MPCVPSCYVLYVCSVYCSLSMKIWMKSSLKQRKTKRNEKRRNLMTLRDILNAMYINKSHLRQTVSSSFYCHANDANRAEKLPPFPPSTTLRRTYVDLYIYTLWYDSTMWSHNNWKRPCEFHSCMCSRCCWTYSSNRITLFISVYRHPAFSFYSSSQPVLALGISFTESTKQMSRLSWFVNKNHGDMFTSTKTE